MKTLGTGEHTLDNWGIEFHDEFLEEFEGWPEDIQDATISQLGPLRVFGPTLGRPSVDTLKGSSFPNMKELRVSAGRGAWRIAFAFDPHRKAILLVGGDKSGISEQRFYGWLIRIVDRRFTEHLANIPQREVK